MTIRRYIHKSFFQKLGLTPPLLLNVLFFGALIVLAATALQAFLNYGSQVDQLDRENEIIRNSYSENLANSIWRKDEERAHALTNQIIASTSFSYIVIRKNQELVFSAGKAISGNTITRGFPLQVLQGTQPVQVGQVSVSVGLDSLYGTVMSDAAKWLAINFVFAISIALYILISAQRTTSIHLTEISEYAKRFDQTADHPPLVLSNENSRAKPTTAFDEVVLSINEMREKLHNGYLALLHSEQRLKDYAEATSDWFWEMDAELKYSFVSERFSEVSDYSPSELVGLPHDILYEGAIDSMEWQQYLSDLDAREPFRDITLGISRKAGEKNWLRMSGQPVFDSGGTFQGYRGTGTDITRELQAREEALKTTLRFLDAIENISDGIAFWDTKDNFVLCNRIFRAQAGEAAEYLVRGTSYENYMRGLLACGAIDKNDDEQENWIAQRLNERKTDMPPVEVYRQGKWFLIRDERTSDGSTVSVVTDLSDVKRREQQIQSVTDAVPILLAYVDEELRYQLINKAYEDWFHVSRRTFQGAPIESSFQEDFYDQIKPHIKTVMSGQFTQFQISLPYTDLSSKRKFRHLEMSFTPNVDKRASIVGFFVAAIDLTDRIEAEDEARKGEDALTEQTQILRASFEAMAQGISIWDETKQLTIWNEPYEQFMRLPPGTLREGIALDEVIRKTISLNQLSPVTAEKLSDDWTKGLDVDSKPAPQHIEYADGQLLILQRHKTEDGRLIIMLTDVTEQTRAQEQLQHTQKIEAIGQLTGGIAHDFNNLLAIIIGSLSLLEDQVHDERPIKLVNSALRASKRGAELTQRLLAFGRRQELISEVSNVNELIDGLFELITRTLGVDIKINSHLDKDLWLVDVDRGQLENAIINLAINARDAMTGGGVLSIDTANILLDKAYASQHPDVEPGAYVMIAVSDTGIGMSEETAERAIEPFFTTKKAGAGSGMGLSMIYGFANQSGGHMTIYSEPDQGTVIRLYLPAIDGVLSESEPATEQPEFTSTGEHILVIEDDDDVRNITVNILYELGYFVTEARNGEEAYAALEQDRKIDLVFSDVFLQSSENGPDIVKSILEHHPEMKILFTSGYTADQFENFDFHPSGMNFIAKPFEIQSLSKKIRDVLGNVSV